MPSGEQVPNRFEGVEFGPAMTALSSDMQRAFVIALFALGTGSAAGAAKAAGYSGKPGSSVWRVAGHRLTQDVRVQAAMQEWGRSVLQMHNPRMVKNLVELANGARGENIRLQATTDLLNRGGLGAVMSVKHEHQHVISFDEKLLELKRLARLAGDDPELATAGLTPATAALAPPSFSEAEYEDLPEPTPRERRPPRASAGPGPEEFTQVRGMPEGSGWTRVKKISDG